MDLKRIISFICSFVYEKGDWTRFICGRRGGGHVIKQSIIDEVKNQKEDLVYTTICVECKMTVYVCQSPIDDCCYWVSPDFDYIKYSDGYLHI